jgi:hypothetical protein
MDYTAATDFSLTTGSAAQPASHLPAAPSGVFPRQQQPPLAENVSNSFSQVSVIPLHIMGTQTPTIVTLIIKHPPSCFVETYKHKLYLLTNADEAISLWSRCFSLR